MKKIQVAAIIVAMTWGGLTSCSKDNSGATASASSMIDPSKSATSSINPSNSAASNTSGIMSNRAPCTTCNSETSVIKVLASGTWHVASFGDPQAYPDFKGYTFAFLSNNEVIVYNDNERLQGTWTVDGKETELDMEFGTTNSPLSYIQGVWNLAEFSSNSVTLRKPDKYPELIFQKN